MTAPTDRRGCIIHQTIFHQMDLSSNARPEKPFCKTDGNQNHARPINKKQDYASPVVCFGSMCIRRFHPCELLNPYLKNSRRRGGHRPPAVCPCVSRKRPVNNRHFEKPGLHSFIELLLCRPWHAYGFLKRQKAMPASACKFICQSQVLIQPPPPRNHLYYQYRKLSRIKRSFLPRLRSLKQPHDRSRRETAASPKPRKKCSAGLRFINGTVWTQAYDGCTYSCRKRLTARTAHCPF